MIIDSATRDAMQDFLKNNIDPTKSFEQNPKVVVLFKQQFGLTDTMEALKMIMNIQMTGRKPLGSHNPQRSVTDIHLPLLNDRFRAIPNDLLYGREKMRQAVTELKEQLRKGVGQQLDTRTKIALYHDYYDLALVNLPVLEIKQDLLHNPEKMEKVIADLKRQLIQQKHIFTRKQIQTTIDLYEQHHRSQLLNRDYECNFSEQQLKSSHYSKMSQTARLAPVPIPAAEVLTRIG